jgi:hypothetical protein
VILDGKVRSHWKIADPNGRLDLGNKDFLIDLYYLWGNGSLSEDATIKKQEAPHNYV